MEGTPPHPTDLQAPNGYRDLSPRQCAPAPQGPADRRPEIRHGGLYLRLHVKEGPRTQGRGRPQTRRDSRQLHAPRECSRMAHPQGLQREPRGWRREKDHQHSELPHTGLLGAVGAHQGARVRGARRGDGGPRRGDDHGGLQCVEAQPTHAPLQGRQGGALSRFSRLQELWRLKEAGRHERGREEGLLQGPRCQGRRHSRCQ